MKKIAFLFFSCMLSLSMFAQQGTSEVITYGSLTTDYEVTVEVVRLDEFNNIVERNIYYLEVDFENSSSSSKVQIVYYEPLNKRTYEAIGVSRGQARILKDSDDSFHAFLQDVFKKAGIVKHHQMREIHKAI